MVSSVSYSYRIWHTTCMPHLTGRGAVCAHEDPSVSYRLRLKAMGQLPEAAQQVHVRSPLPPTLDGYPWVATVTQG